MPLQIPDQTVALRTQAPDGMQSIASLLNIAGGAQSLKKAQATFDSDVAQRASEASMADSNAQVSKATITPRIDQQNEAANQARTQSAAAQFKLSGDYLDKANQIGQGLLADPDIASGDINKIVPRILSARQRMIDAGVPAATAEVQAAHLLTAAVKDPHGLPQLLKTSIVQSTPSTQQGSAMTPTLAQNSNGQQIISTNINPLAPGGVGSQAIAPIQMQLPPTTPTVENGTPGYLGPQPVAQGASRTGFDPSKLSPELLAHIAQQYPNEFKQGIQDFTQRGPAQTPQQPARVISGLPIGASGAIEGTQGEINKHWTDTQASAGTAQQNIGILQNIKQHAGGAATGLGADKQAFVQGLAGLLGMDAGQLARTDTDLLAKNSNMLALAGGNTDSARALATAANPNSHMTKEAIELAADQIIGQQKLNLARAQFLAPHKAMADQGHPENYINARAQFNSVADPRVIQFTSMSPEEKIALKSSMSEKERAEFGAKLGKARSLGIAQ